VSGIGVGTLAGLIGNLFTVYLFGATPLGNVLSFLFILIVITAMAYKYGLGGDAILLIIGVTGLMAGVFMFSDIGLKAIVGASFGILLFISIIRLIRR
jgi:hypothetical protein